MKNKIIQKENVKSNNNSSLESIKYSLKQNELDKTIYKIYGLTLEEIKTVEES